MKAVKLTREQIVQAADVMQELKHLASIRLDVEDSNIEDGTPEPANGGPVPERASPSGKWMSWEEISNIADDARTELMKKFHLTEIKLQRVTDLLRRSAETNAKLAKENAWTADERNKLSARCNAFNEQVNTLEKANAKLSASMREVASGMREQVWGNENTDRLTFITYTVLRWIEKLEAHMKQPGTPELSDQPQEIFAPPPMQMTATEAVDRANNPGKYRMRHLAERLDGQGMRLARLETKFANFIKRYDDK